MLSGIRERSTLHSADPYSELPKAGGKAKGYRKFQVIPQRKVLSGNSSLDAGGHTAQAQATLTAEPWWRSGHRPSAVGGAAEDYRGPSVTLLPTRRETWSYCFFLARTQTPHTLSPPQVKQRLFQGKFLSKYR